MKQVFILLMFLFVVSCVTQQRCVEKFPPEVVTEYRDSVIERTVVEYRDTTIYETLPAETSYVEREGRVVDLMLNIDPIYRENDFAKSCAWVTNNRLSLEMLQKDTTLSFYLDDAISEEKKEVRHEQVFEKKAVTHVKYIPKFYKFTLVWFVVSVAATGVWLWMKLRY